MKAARGPRLGACEVVYRNSYHRVYSVTADFGAWSKKYFVTDYGARTGVVAVDGSDVLLVRQYRLLIDDLSWEIPGGRVEPGESPRQAAIRECLEESGVRCRRLRPLIAFQPGLDTLNNPTQVYYTTEFTEMTRHRVQQGEVQQHQWVPLRRCLEMTENGKILDSLSIIALLAYWRRFCDRSAAAPTQLRVQL